MSDENKEVSNTDEGKLEVEPQVDQNVEEAVEAKQDRPDQNFLAEIARKNAEIARLKAEAATRVEQPQKRDPNDIRTWPDHELRMLKKDPQFAQYHDQADDILLERKVLGLESKRRADEARVKSDMEVKQTFPELNDPSSALSLKVEEMMHKYDLSKTPAGRLVAAKLASAELNKGRSTTDSVARKKEQDRVAAVKQQMVDGDRAKPTQETQQDLDNKRKSLQEKLITGRSKEQAEVIGEIFKDRFGGSDGFFNRK